MTRWNVAGWVVASMCAHHALGHAEEAKPGAASKKPIAAVPAAAAATVPTATVPKKPKKPRKRSASENFRPSELAKEAAAFADLIAATSLEPTVVAGNFTDVSIDTGGGGGGVGAATYAGTGVRSSGNGPRDKAPANGSVRLVVLGVGESPPATTAIRSRINARLTSVKRCTQFSGATVASKTTLEFAIQEAGTGRVVDLKASGNNQVVVDCVVKSAALWRFPEPENNSAEARFEVTFISTP